MQIAALIRHPRKQVSYEDYGEPVQVAAFTGAGVKGTTPWIQPLSVTPADAALLAGGTRILFGPYGSSCTGSLSEQTHCNARPSCIVYPNLDAL